MSFFDGFTLSDPTIPTEKEKWGCTAGIGTHIYIYRFLDLVSTRLCIEEADPPSRHIVLFLHVFFSGTNETHERKCLTFVDGALIALASHVRRKESYRSVPIASSIPQQEPIVRIRMSSGSVCVKIVVKQSKSKRAGM